jgi:hypothetical protein
VDTLKSKGLPGVLAFITRPVSLGAVMTPEIVRSKPDCLEDAVVLLQYQPDLTGRDPLIQRTLGEFDHDTPKKKFQIAVRIVRTLPERGARGFYSTNYSDMPCRHESLRGLGEALVGIAAASKSLDFLLRCLSIPDVISASSSVPGYRKLPMTKTFAEF